MKIIPKIILSTLAVAIIVVATYFYVNFLSRTHIAFINYQPITLEEIVRANDNPMIVISEIDPTEFDKLKDYDMVFISAMGMNITEDQRQILKDFAAQGKPFLTTAATNPANAINNLGSDEEILKLYIAGGNRANFRNMLAYVRAYIDGKVIYAPEPAEATQAPEYLISHPDPDDATGEDLGFNSVKDYHRFLADHNLLSDAPRVIVTGVMGRGSDLVSELEAQGLVAYNITAIRSAMMAGQLDSIQPSAIINMAHGRMGDYMVDYLAEHNIPLFAPLNVNRLATDWEADKQGMSGGFLSQSVVMPELDGALRPYTLFAHYVNDRGIREVRAIPGRLTHFVASVANHIKLKSIANKDKKVCIVYFKGPGQSNLVASGMEVMPSLYNLLTRLRAEGYNVQGLPSSWQGLQERIMNEGRVFGTYAEGALADYASANLGARVSAREWETWSKATLTERQLDELRETNGDFPGEYLAVDDEVVLPRVEFGNVVLMPQLPASGGSDSFAMVHGAEVAPPYPYVLSYLWAREGFQADAIIHFGTHGGLEYTPRKQNALGDDDWSQALIGDLPHLYIYTIGNVGEALIAKRRSLACIQSHLTAPFKETNLRGSLRSLSAAVDAYQSIDETVAANASSLAMAANKVKQLTHELGIDAELRISDSKDYVYTASDVLRIEQYAEEVSNEKMTGALYTLGVPYVSSDVVSTVVAMASDPIAYSLLALDKMRGKVGQDFERQSPSQFTKRYLQPARTIVETLLKSGKSVDQAYVCRVSGLTAADLEKAHDVESRLNAPSSMMAMMTTAMQSSRNAGGMAAMMSSGGSRDSSGVASGHPKMSPAMMAKMKAMARSMTPEQMLAKAREMGADSVALARMEAKMKEKAASGDTTSTGMKGMGMGGSLAVSIPQSARDSSRIILALENALLNVLNYSEALATSPEKELETVVNSLAGGYTRPQPGGDPVANQNAVPTGRNLYGINADATPSEHAWEQGKQLAQATIDAYREQNDGAYPRKVSYTLWSGEFVETQGATVAQILYMLGVEPIRDVFGRVNDLRLIPSSELGRPRIDVAVQTSGQLRDLAASRLFLINRAVTMAAEAADSGNYVNQVAEGINASERYLVEKGVSPREAREIAHHRVFGAQNGGYGTGIQAMVEKGDAWDTQDQLAETYLNNMNAFYGSEEAWEQNAQFAFEAALTGTDAIVQPRQSNTWGALSLDHVYEFTGGLSSAVSKVTGKEPMALLSDYRNHHRVKMQDLGEAIASEGRTTLFNPEYIKEMMKGDASSAGEISAMVTNTYGWSSLRKSAIDKNHYNKIYDTYVKDVNGLGTRDFFEKKNHAALQEITAVMMESARKGFWDATEQQLADVAQLHTELIEKHKPACSGFVCDNAKLRDYIAQKAPDAKSYQQAIQQVREANLENVQDGKVMKKETLRSASESSETTVSAGVVIAIVAVALIAIILLVRRRRNSID